MIRAATSLQSLQLRSLPQDQPPAAAANKSFYWRDWVRYAWSFVPSWSGVSHPELEEMKFTPRSYDKNIMKVFNEKRDPSFLLAFVNRGLNAISLPDLIKTSNFWVDRHLDVVCSAIGDGPFEVLLQLTPQENFIQYPCHCKTPKQIELVLDMALNDEEKLKDITDIVLIAIGDKRNTDELNQLYYYYLRLLIQKKEKPDPFIAERLRANWSKLEEAQIEALKKTEIAPLVQKFIDENLPRS